MPKETPVERECKDCFDSEYRDGIHVPSGSDRCRECRKTKKAQSSPRATKKAEPVLSDAEFDEKYKSVMKAVEEHEKEERERRIKIAQEL